MDKGFEAVTVLDLSEKALATAKARLGTLGAKVRWVVADVTTWEPSGSRMQIFGTAAVGRPF